VHCIQDVIKQNSIACYKQISELCDWLTCRRSLSKARQASQHGRAGWRRAWAAASPSCRTPLWLSRAPQLSRNNWTYEQSCSAVTRPEKREKNISILFKLSGFNSYTKQHSVILNSVFTFISIFGVKQNFKHCLNSRENVLQSPSMQIHYQHTDLLGIRTHTHYVPMNYTRKTIILLGTDST